METRYYERDTSLLAIEDVSHMPFKWAIGIENSKFFQEIRDREVLVGIKCQSCGRVYVPPRMVCGPCFVKMHEIVELGHEGVVHAVTLVNYPFIDPDTGKRRPVPYVYGYILLDGADNPILAYYTGKRNGICESRRPRQGRICLREERASSGYRLF